MATTSEDALADLDALLSDLERTQQELDDGEEEMESNGTAKCRDILNLLTKYSQTGYY